MPLEVRETDAADALLETLLAEHAARHAAAPARAVALPTLLARIAQHHALGAKQHAVSPFERMQHARDALAYLDTVGWKRSYHQRMFHEDFLVPPLSTYFLDVFLRAGVGRVQDVEFVGCQLRKCI